MRLVRAAPADLPAVVDLLNLAYRSAPAIAGREWSTEAGYIIGDRMTLPMLAGDLAANPGARLMLWRGAEGIAGCVWLEPAGGPPPSIEAVGRENTWYLGMLTVRPDRQGGGAGGQLLDAAEVEARALGAERIRMTVVNVRDGLIAWYERRGYRLTGEVLPFPYDDLRFGAPTRPDLTFVVLERALG
jgi:GNAT superfamily N-acetyltransferase